MMSQQQRLFLLDKGERMVMQPVEMYCRILSWYLPGNDEKSNGKYLTEMSVSLEEF
jgi:hypothetical protein